MLFRSLLLTILLLVPMPGLGQNKANQWYITDEVLLNFNQNPPSFFSEFHLNHDAGSSMSIHSSASVSNNDGEVMFHFFGGNLHQPWKESPTQILPDSIMDNSQIYGQEEIKTTKNFVIKMPGFDNRYCIFTHFYDFEYKKNVIDTSALYYHIYEIDSVGDSGRLVSRMNLLTKGASNAVAATKHANGRDYWIMTFDAVKNQYQAFLLNESGFSKSVTSPSAMNFDSDSLDSRIKFTPDGNTMAHSCTVFDYNDTIDVFHRIENFKEVARFDPSSGKVSQKITWHNRAGYSSITHGVHDLEFSPCGNNLFVNNPGQDSSNILQYWLAPFDSGAIQRSKTTIAQSDDNYKYHSLQLAPNGKIYVIEPYAIKIIENPNAPPGNIDFGNELFNTNNYDEINNLHNEPQLFPDFPSNYFSSPLIDDYSSHLCLSDTATFTFKNQCLFDSAQWHFDDPASTNNTASTFNARHQFSDTGKYKVQVIGWDGSVPDTVYKTVQVYNNAKPALPKDTALCKTQTLTLPSETSRGTYEWLNYSEDTLRITNGQKIHYTFEGQCGQTRDSLIVRFQEEAPSVNLPNDTVICTGQFLEVKVKQVDRYHYYQWSHGPQKPQTTIKASGNYQLKARNGCGEGRDSISIQFVEDFGFADSLKLCKGEALNPVLMPDSFDFQWSTGATGVSIVPESPGLYWVEASHPRCGTIRDSVQVALTQLPALNLPADTTGCQGKTIQLKVGEGYDTYHWSNGNRGRMVAIRQSGKFTLTARKDGCEKSVSTSVQFSEAPEPGLPAHDTLCPEADGYVTLEANKAYRHQWAPTGASGRTLEVREPGTYTVTTTDPNGCQATDTTEVHEYCAGKLYFPNAFRPSSDEGNDVFRPVGKKVHDYRLKIFNRWGEKIFSTTDPNEGWDGTYKGHKAPAGIYIYSCNYKLRQAEGHFEHENKVGTLKLMK